jgi:serine/threonine protein kinase
MDFPRVPQRAEETEQRGLVIQRTTVLTLSQRVVSAADPAGGEGARDLGSGLAVAGGSMVLPGLRSEERLLLGLVDGRLSVARLARLAGLSEDATAAHLRALCHRGVLVPVEPSEVTIRGTSGEPFFRLGPYEVASRLGQGGMGSVYVCRKAGAAGFRRLLALKVIRQGSGQEPAAERSFLREVRVGVLLDHPNIQSLVDVGMYKNQPFLVLQYIEGTSLEDVSFGRRVPPAVLVTILIDVLRGLQRAHEIADEQGRWLGLVHGDVSAPNVLIGLDGIARLTDFGSARFTALGETDTLDPLTVGKPAYMAPEQLRGEPLDARTDVFAVGVMMWTALTGQELFTDEGYEQIVANVMGKEIEPPSAYGAPRCLDEICLRALSRPREGRPASAGEMAQVLLRIGVENGLLAAPSTVGAHIRREVSGADLERRRRIDSAFADAAATSGPDLSPSVTIVAAPAAPASPASPASQERSRATLLISRASLALHRTRFGVLVKRWVTGGGVGFFALWMSLAILAALVTVAIAGHHRRVDPPAQGPDRRSSIDANGPVCYG